MLGSQCPECGATYSEEGDSCAARFDELLALSDRLVVLYEGRIVGETSVSDADPEQLGMLMAGRGRAA